MSSKLFNRICISLTFLIAFLLIYLNKDNGFFWDTVQLAYAHGNFYYSNNFSGLLLPAGIDSGHIPTFGMYIALAWKIFGRTIAVSHLAMLPFAFGIIWQLQILCRRFIREKYIGIAVLLIFIDATLMAQITLVSPDVPLVFFFLMALNAVFKNNKPLITISIILLFLTSMRGMMLSLCLVLIDVHVNIGYSQLLKSEKVKTLFKRSLLYIPALLIFVAYNIYHYSETGWIGYHKDSPWANCFEKVGFKGFMVNIGYLGWRILDFGRIAVWIVFLRLLLKYKSEIVKDKKNHVLFFSFIVIVILLPLNMLWAKNLMAHRYLMPVYLAFSILCASVLFSDFVAPKLRNMLIAIWIIVSLSGNFWIYPPKVSKGWDSTLAHLPYYKLRLQLLDYLDANKIEFKDVDTFFPGYHPGAVIDLNNDPRTFDNYTIGNGSQYVFYSNIFNIDDVIYDDILSNYSPIQRFEKNGVYVILFKKK